MKLTKRAVGACARAEFKRSPLVLAMVAAMSIHASAQAESFPAEIDLSDLDGSNGFRILGGAGFFVGNSVSSAGDFNGDGFADIVLGDRYGDGTNYDPFPYPGDVNFNRPPGAAYILFGGADVGSTGTFQLSAPDGTDGILISGYDDEDGLGFSVSDAGDINGDGFADVIIGAPEAESVYSATYDASGTSYIVFGGADVGNTGFLSQATVASGENGFVITGVDNVDQSGFSVSSAGDINGDGAADVIVGAPYAGANRSGQSYVVFGGTDAGTNPVDLSELDGSNGFTIDGSDSDYLLGSSVSVAGDFNGDGLSDIIVGKPYIDGTDTGEAIVLFGGDNVGASGTVDLSSLDGTNSLVISGIPSYGFGAFFPVSDAGDFNGDGLSDVIIGARYADPNGNEQAGQSFIVFGGDNVGESGTLDLADLDGSNGLVIDGLNAYDALGNAVSSAGDVNGDGVDDVIIGAANADPSGIPYAGQSFVVFGGSDVGSSGEFDLTSLDGSNGFVLSGIDEFNGVGTAVSTAGDFNGDGVSDLVVGSYEAGPGFVVFGVQEPVTSGGPDPEPTLSCNGLPVTVNLALGQSPTSSTQVLEMISLTQVLAMTACSVFLEPMCCVDVQVPIVYSAVVVKTLSMAMAAQTV